MRQFHGLIFLGNGMYSAFQVEGLLDRVREAHHLSCGMQQAPTDEITSAETTAIKDVILDVAASLGYAIEFVGGLDYPPKIENMSADSPEGKYCVKKYSSNRDEWTRVRYGLVENYIFNKKEALALLESCRGPLLDDPSRSEYWMFPLGILEPKDELPNKIELDVKFSLSTDKLSPERLKEVVEAAIDYYLEEVGIDEDKENFNYSLNVELKGEKNG